MVKGWRAGHWKPVRFWRRLRSLLRQPGDLWLSFQLAFLIWSVPRRLERQSLPALLEELETAPRPAVADFRSGVERVARLSRSWFKLRSFHGRNTCYVRSLMFYRFVDPQGRAARIHFLVESRRSEGDRVRGHAWVSVEREFCERPREEILARATSISTHLPDERA